MSVLKHFQDRLNDWSQPYSGAPMPGTQRQSSRTLCDAGAQTAQSTLLCLEALRQQHRRKTKRQKGHGDAILLVRSLPWPCHPSEGHLEGITGPTLSFHIPTASLKHPVLSGVNPSPTGPRLSSWGSWVGWCPLFRDRSSVGPSPAI